MVGVHRLNQHHPKCGIISHDGGIAIFFAPVGRGDTSSVGGSFLYCVGTPNGRHYGSTKSPTRPW